MSARLLREAHVPLEAHHQGKNVIKSKSEATLVHPARLADGLLQSLVFSAQIHSEKFPGIINVRPGGTEPLVAAASVLGQMGDRERWASREKVGA